MSGTLFKEGVLPSSLLPAALTQIEDIEALLREDELTLDQRRIVEKFLMQAKTNYRNLENLALGQRPSNDLIQ
ncbi:hypothetical protein HY339_00105 [Candidatus Gottesmanbacteria bacterium]|nr:hypothetical protein [Candidatus Gottesmanbacteria bacterium]